MMIQFTKMQGLGNDFAVIDATQKPLQLTAQQIKKMSDRHFGIGFDQLLVIEASSDAAADFNYRIFNADGSSAEQCGNGARCIGKYIHDHKLSAKKEIVVSTLAGNLPIILEADGQVTVNMGIPIFDPKMIPYKATHQTDRYQLPLENESITIGSVSMGNPHAVILVTDASTAPVKELGTKIENHPNFPKRTNVEFMQIINPQQIHLRVFERGAGETLACGTGACAAVVIGRLWQKLAEKVSVHLPGGTLIISWQGPNHPVWMTGPAEEVFTGTYTIINHNHNK